MANTVLILNLGLIIALITYGISHAIYVRMAERSSFDSPEDVHELKRMKESQEKTRRDSLKDSIKDVIDMPVVPVHPEDRNGMNSRYILNESRKDYFKKKIRLSYAERKERKQKLQKQEEEAKEAYLDSTTPGFFHYLILFIFGSVLGLIAEEIWMFYSQGRIESRVGMVWGPFSPLYGFGIVLFTLLFWNMRRESYLKIFIVSTIVGGLLEQIVGWGMEILWNAQSWTYIGLPDAITQWVSVRSMLTWGVLGVVYTKLLMPEIIWRIGEPSRLVHVILCAFIVGFLVLDIVVTFYSFYRQGQRAENIPPQNPVDAYVDEHYGDEFIKDRFQNLVVGEDLEPNS